jgi:hypothetical protein
MVRGDADRECHHGAGTGVQEGHEQAGEDPPFHRNHILFHAIYENRS